MDSTSVLFSDKCRICLLQLGVSNIISNDDLAEDIFTFTGIKVKQSDNLPQKICTKCLEVIEKAKDLREVAMNNDKLLCALFDVKEEEVHMVKYEKKTKIERKEEKERKGEKKRKDLFETPKIVKSTEKLHKREDKYFCGICKKHYATQKKLYLHNRQHNKKIPCPLDACGKKFAAKGDLEKHLRSHTGVKPYICDICDKGFSQQVTLKVHRETVHCCFTFS